MSDSQTKPHTNRARTPGRRLSIGARKICRALVLTIGLGAVAGGLTASGSPQSGADREGLPPEKPTFTDAQSLFYNARYEAAAEASFALRTSESQDLANDELRTSALLFQLKALLEGPIGKDGDKAEKADKERALKACDVCPALIAEFIEDTHHGQNLARAMLRDNPNDEAALFFLGKLDLNYVWLQLGPLGRKTGWDEYWEARRSLDAVIKLHPQHVRALVARAWIDYIVDTRMPWGTRWVLGGGSKKKALTAMHNAAQLESDFFSHAEAEFALWNIRVRERDMAQATEVAQRLSRDFPDNREVAAFLEARAASAQP